MLEKLEKCVVDSHGVVTMFLICNLSTKLIVDNKSNVYRLHIDPPSFKFFFASQLCKCTRSRNKELVVHAWGRKRDE
ncbi:hypothetical protein YC2023_038370 [Brassica napus]